MKNILFYILLLFAGLFSACQKDELKGIGENEDGVAISLRSASPEISTTDLGAMVAPLHLLIFDGQGRFVKHEKYGSLATAVPVKLANGNYTFAYLTNVEESQIGGMKEGAKLEDITVSMIDVDGKIPGTEVIFSGMDTIVVGKDRQSDAALKRQVGLLQVNVRGLNAGVKVKSVTLMGSPKTVRFNGEGIGNSVPVDVPVNLHPDSLLYRGSVIAFPTKKDSLAVLQFVVEVAGVEKTYTAPLKSKVEANKIHTINVKSNVSLPVWDVTLTMEVSEWGATTAEDLTLNETPLIESPVFKFVMEDGSDVDLKKAGRFQFFLRNEKGDFSFFYDEGNGGIVSYSGDTLFYLSVIPSALPVGDFEVPYVEFFNVKDSTMIYRLADKSLKVVLNESGVVNIVLPKLQTVAATDRQAMLDLRDALKGVSVIDKLWESYGDEVALWPQVKFNEQGRVVSIGYDQMSREEDKPIAGKQLQMSRMADRIVSGKVWSLPESFKNLTALKIFTIEAPGMREIPAFLKNMTSLEQLSVEIESSTLPELPDLKYLEIESDKLTAIPAQIETLTNLQVVYFRALERNGSKITAIGADFSKLPLLNSLAIEASSTCKLPASVWSCTGLEELGLGGFDKITVPASLNINSLKELALYSESIKPADIEMIGKLSLTFLEIESPVFGADGLPDWLGSMGSLEELSLDGCGLVSIPAGFDGLTNLEFLEVKRNPALSGKLPAGLLKRYSSGLLQVYYDESPNFSPDGVILSVDKSQLTMGRSGGKLSFRIISNVDWRIDVRNMDWDDVGDLVVDPLTGKGNRIISVTVPPLPESTGAYNHEIIISDNGEHAVRVVIFQS